jgi:H+/gluconate symporter-like permease
MARDRATGNRRRRQQVIHRLIQNYYGATHTAELPGLAKPVTTQISSVAAVWAVEAALLLGIITVVVFAFGRIKERFADGSKAAVAGALLAAMNTASEYGFGGVIAALPGFLIIADGLKAIPGVLVNEAVTVTALAGITGSASGGMSIALATMADTFIASADAAAFRSKCCIASPRWRAAAWIRCRTTAR